MTILDFELSTLPNPNLDARTPRPLVTISRREVTMSTDTTNIIMTKWSKEMWQGMVNRVVRDLASGKFGSNSQHLPPSHERETEP
uniref:Uncharacterized protein n=1 Tax=Angiostrongylus cantonensis TaxID=6313 RepID=A0A0K0CZY1_ANGCA